MWKSRFLLCSKCEGMFLITFFPSPPYNPPNSRGAAASVHKYSRKLGISFIFRQKRRGKNWKTFPLILKLNHFVSINYSTAFRIFSPLGGALSLHQAPHYVALHNMLRTRYMDFVWNFFSYQLICIYLIIFKTPKQTNPCSKWAKNH